MLRTPCSHPPICPPPLQHGDAFTLCLLGQRMTFVLAPAALPRYFTAPDSLLTFAPAVQQVQRAEVWGASGMEQARQRWE